MSVVQLAPDRTQVVIVDEQQLADACEKLIANYPWRAMSMNSDFTSYRGQRCVVVGRAGEAAQLTMKVMAKRLFDAGAAEVKIVPPEHGRPEGWGLDVALQEGWDGKRIIDWLRCNALIYPRRTPPKANGSSVLGDVFYRAMSQVQSKSIDWLWPGRFAKGKVSMIVGNPGLGKSQLCASMVSVVSNGSAWPVDRSPCAGGSVVILSAEDDPEDTIRPRLEAAGADLDKVFILEAIHVERDDGTGKRGFDLTVDIPRLGALLHDLKDAAMVVIDPITAYLGDADSHKNAEVRALLAPLADMAAAQRVAVIAVSHLTKSSGMEALLRVQGSIGFAAAARAVWGVAKDKENPARRLFMPLKNNLGTDNAGFAYSIEGIRLPESEIDTSHIMWENTLITQAAEDIFGGEATEDRGRKSDAKGFLEDLLREGPVPYKQVRRDCDGAGHHWRTIERAKEEIGVVCFKEGFGKSGEWRWRLP